MAPSDNKPNSEESVSEKSSLTVIHRTKHDKKDISKEPEMKELKRMIRTGALDPERTIDHLKGDKQHGRIRTFNLDALRTPKNKKYGYFIHFNTQAKLKRDCAWRKGGKQGENV